MSPNEIEEMLASMTAEVPEEASQDSEEDALVEQIVNELLPDASGPVAEEEREPEAADFDTGILYWRNRNQRQAALTGR